MSANVCDTDDDTDELPDAYIDDDGNIIDLIDNINTHLFINDDEEIVKKAQIINNICKVFDSNKCFYSKRNVDKMQISNVAPFYSEIIPSILIKEYIIRIVQYAHASSSMLIVSMILLQRFCNIKDYIINVYAVHRLFLVSFLISVKLYEDSFKNNAYYAHIGGIPLKEINDLELCFLGAINFDLCITTEEYEKMFNQLIN